MGKNWKTADWLDHFNLYVAGLSDLDQHLVYYAPDAPEDCSLASTLWPMQNSSVTVRWEDSNIEWAEGVYTLTATLNDITTAPIVNFGGGCYAFNDAPEMLQVRIHLSDNVPTPTPTPTPPPPCSTPSPTPSPTPCPEGEICPTPTPGPSPTPCPTGTPTPTPGPTATPQPTGTPQPSPTPEPTATPEQCFNALGQTVPCPPTPTATPTPEATATPTPTAVNTPTPTATPTPTPTPSSCEECQWSDIDPSYFTATLKIGFPNLIYDHTCEEESGGDYNCLAWTVGRTDFTLFYQMDLNPPDKHISVQEYLDYCNDPVNACPIQDGVKLYGKKTPKYEEAENIRHGARSDKPLCPGGVNGASSKLGQRIRMNHIFSELEGGNYGNIVPFP